MANGQTIEASLTSGAGEFFFSVGTIGLSKCGGRKPSMLIQAARHNRRAIQAELGARSHIDAERIHLNETIAGPDTPAGVAALAQDLMAGAGVNVPKLRKDHTQAIELLFSLAPGTPISSDDYFRRCVEWVGSHFGAANILSADIHRDESAPHCHVLVLPLVDGRMRGSDLIARAELVKLRQSFSLNVAQAFGLKAPPGRMAGAMRAQAVIMVLERLEATRDPVMSSPLWQTIKRDIERDPARFVAALGIEVVPVAKERKKRTMAQIFTSPGKGGKFDKEPKPIGFAKPVSAKPIGFENSPEKATQKEQTLTSVGFDQKAPHSTHIKPARNEVLEVARSGTQADDSSNDLDQDGAIEVIRERDGDKMTGQWNDELGEFIQAAGATTRPSRQAADSWVAAGLAQQRRRTSAATTIKQTY
jgi:hypothetical protein